MTIETKFKHIVGCSNYIKQNPDRSPGLLRDQEKRGTVNLGFTTLSDRHRFMSD